MRAVLITCAVLAGAADARADTCPAAHVAVPSAFDNRTAHDAPVADVEDFGDHTLDPVLDKLARVARGTPGAVVRIGIYGDSNWTNDNTAGEIRRRLQLAFGDAGHGWVAFGAPWAGYHHHHVQHGQTGAWTTWSLTAQAVPDRLYGFAGSAAQSSQVGATVWVETAKAGEPIGTAVSSFELAYLARPKGGSFEVSIDHESKGIVETENATAQTRYLRYAVKDGPHRLTVTVKRGTVRVFGATLERDTTGVIVDGIGMNALNPPTMLRMDPDSMSAGLAHRNYDLLIEVTGTMVWFPRQHPAAMPTVLSLFRAALPKAALMLWSVPDFVAIGRTPAVSEGYMGVYAKERREMAKAARIAFWDQYTTLGGPGSAPRFLRAGWTQSDGIHIAPKLSAYIAERFVYALDTELARRLDRDPRLGCR